MYKCCTCENLFESYSIMANHVRWNHLHRGDTTRYNKRCCCIICKQEITVQSLKQHIKKHEVKGSCMFCKTDLFRKGKYCSSKCSAKHTNSLRDYTKFKPGPKKKTKEELEELRKIKRPPYTKIKQCEICKAFHKGKGRSCSQKCKSVILSTLVQERLNNGWNPNENRNRSTPSYLEKSFENWLQTNKIRDYTKNKTFRCDKKIYYGDFFFKDLNLLVELDGSQHENTKEYDLERDNAILLHHGVRTLRISHKEYREKTKIKLLEQILIRSSTN